jgi:multidrug efflux pump subunit AcrB
MNYWETQKSFWKTPTGVVIWMGMLAIILGGLLLALNLFTSPFPIIESFDVDPVVILPGGSANLSWSVIGATQVVIDQGIGIVELKGTRSVSPSETSVYTLTAVNGTRNRSADVQVIVEGS